MALAGEGSRPPSDSDVPLPSGVNEHVELLLAIGRATADVRDLDAMIAAVLELELAALDVDVAALHEVVGSTLVMRGLVAPNVIVSDDLRDFVSTIPLALDTLVGRAVAMRRPVRVSRYEWPRDCVPCAEGFAARFGAAAPLLVGDRLIGALTVLRRADRSLNRAESRLLETSATQLAAAIEHARLLAEERERARELAAINEMGRLVTEQLDVKSVLDVGVRHLSSIAGGVNVFVMLIEGESLDLVATNVAHAHAPGIRIPLAGTSVSTASLRSREPLLVEDVASDPRVDRRLADRFRHRSILSVPLLARGEPIGSVTLGSSREGVSFTARDVEYAVAISHQFAIAIANARLIEDLKSSYAVLEETQRALVEHERLAALGELSAVVAHEVRNPLAIIWNSLGALRHKLRPEGEVAELLDIVREESSRLNRMVSDLLDYARPNRADLRPEDVTASLEEAVDAARATFPDRDIALGVRVPDHVPQVLADARLLRQALVNLVNNAIQAVPDGGRVDVDVAVDHEAHRMRIRIADDGIGLTDEAQTRLFQPFFTTKATGTGLGLALVKRIVDAHHGTVSVAPNGRRGAAFTVELPLADVQRAG